MGKIILKYSEETFQLLRDIGLLVDSLRKQLAESQAREAELRQNVADAATKAADYQQTIASLREELAASQELATSLQEEIDLWKWKAQEKPGLVDRLVTVGYTAESAGSILDAAGPTGAVRATELREGLYTIGYTTTEMDECMEDVPQLKMADITHAQEILEAWDPETTRLALNGVNFKDDSLLVVFPKVDFSKVTYTEYLVFGSPNLAYMPLLDTSALVTCNGSNFLCTGDKALVKLKRIPNFDFSNVENYTGGLTSNCPELEIMPPTLSFPKAKSLNSLFAGNKKQTVFPEVQFTDAVTSMNQFQEATSVTYPLITDFKYAGSLKRMFTGIGKPLDLKNYTIKSRADKVNLGGFFFYDGKVVSFPKFEFNDVSDLSYFIVWAMQLPDSIPDFSAWGGVTDFECFMYNGHSLTNVKRVEGLNFASCQNTLNMFYGCSSLRFIRILNLGKGSCTSYSFSSCRNWGVNDSSNPDARQSLVDTLLTNSYDRAAAGLSAITVSLSSASRNALTNEEKAAITAKGITLS